MAMEKSWNFAPNFSQIYDYVVCTKKRSIGRVEKYAFSNVFPQKFLNTNFDQIIGRCLAKVICKMCKP